MSYTSLNGYKVSKADNPTLINPEIKELLTDAISFTNFKSPIYIPDSKMVYDHEIIKNCLLISDKDPLTNIKLNKENVKFIPVLNYFLALLCLEEKNGDIYYHAPLGNIMDIFEIADYLFNGYETIHKIPNGTISLNLTHYTDKYVIDQDIMTCDLTVKHSYYTQDDLNRKCSLYNVSLEDILIKCPISRKPFNGKVFISDKGIFIHSQIEMDREILCSSRGMTLSNFNSMFQFEKENTFNVQKLNEFFGVSFDGKIMVTNCGDGKDCTKYYEVDKLESIDLMKIEYYSMSYILMLLFKKQKSVIADDHHLTATSTEENIYQFYLKHKDTIDPKAKSLLSDILVKRDLSNFGPEFIKKREFYKFPSLHQSENMCYGNDYSFLEITNRKIVGKHLKMIHFVGTEFNNVIFDDCHFSSCSFIGAKTSKLVMVNCKFDNYMFYKTNEPIMID